MTKWREILTRIRTVAAWSTLVFALNFLMAHYSIVDLYVYLDPQTPRSLIWWRAISLLLTLISGLISFPRWQSLVGLSLTIFILYSALKV